MSRKKSLSSRTVMYATLSTESLCLGSRPISLFRLRVTYTYYYYIYAPSPHAFVIRVLSSLADHNDSMPTKHFHNKVYNISIVSAAYVYCPSITRYSIFVRIFIITLFPCRGRYKLSFRCSTYRLNCYNHIIIY